MSESAADLPAATTLGGAARARFGARLMPATWLAVSEDRRCSEPIAVDTLELETESELCRLHELSMRLLEIEDLQQLLDRILDGAMALYRADFGMLQIACGETNSLHTASRRGFDPPHTREDFEALRSFAEDAGFAALHCDPIAGCDGLFRGTLTVFFRSAHRPSAQHSSLGAMYARTAGDLIGELRRKEVLRNSCQAAEKACEAKAQVLATASHDLRQPLQTLALLNGSLRRLTKDIRLMPALEEQERAIATASDLLNALLDICKLESGAVQPCIADFGIAELLGEIQEDFSATALTKGLKLHVEACAGRVHSDRALVSQILRNLVSNAIRYTPVGCVRLRCSPEGRSLRVDVIDTGIGIPADALPRIFDEFFQVGTSTLHEGHGLGLSIVQRTARLLGHEIRVRSTLDRGSCFTLVLPRGS